MGFSDIVPGVSGGTIALVTGIYERLVKAVGNLNVSFILKREGRKRHLMSMDPFFLLPLGIGITSALYAGSYAMAYLLENYKAVTYSFFIGLILASAFLILKEKIRSFSFAGYSLLLVGISSGFLVSGIRSLHESHSLLSIFLSGFLALCAMILPGISGSFVLVMLGQYKFMLDSLHDLPASFPVVAVFIAGGAIGLILFSRLIRRLLASYHDLTLMFLVGLMLGSLRVLVSGLFSPEGTGSFAEALGVFAFIALTIGAGLVAALNLLASKIRKL